LVSSLVIFGVVFFTVIKPSENTANQALKQGLQQTQQVIKQSEKALKTSGAAASGSSAAAGGSSAAAAGTKAAQKTLSNAQKLTTCVAAAGTDPSKLSACSSKYGH
jgi:hypothetical protein